MTQDNRNITMAQAVALHRVFMRAPLYWDGAMARNLDNEPSAPEMTFEDFVGQCQLSTDCVMVPWCGMWLGIEQDGYTHS